MMNMSNINSQVEPILITNSNVQSHDLETFVSVIACSRLGCKLQIGQFRDDRIFPAFTTTPLQIDEGCNN